MTAANPRAPFRVDDPRLETRRVIDADGCLMARFNGPDRQARAEALAAEYEQTYGPEWVVKGVFLESRSTGYSLGIGDAAMREHLRRLLNEHGGPQ